MGTMRLEDLRSAATAMGYNAATVNTGGGVVALSVRLDGHWALIALDGGREDGSDWVVALDGPARDAYGEAECAPVPVSSDAEQTVRDAASWIRHAVRVLTVQGGDQRIAVRMQLAEIRAEFEPADTDAYDAFTVRFGEIASENLASWCTGVHATSEEMMVLAACEFPRYREIMLRGE